MKQKLKILLLIICVINCFNMIAQTLLQPQTPRPKLLWASSGGESGYCGEGFEPEESVCSATICLGESICFSYQLVLSNGDYTAYTSNHEPLSFSDGTTIVIENSNYSGPNSTGCVNFVPTTSGVITSSGIYLPFEITVLPATPAVLSTNLSPSNPICLGSQVCIESLTSPFINYAFTTSTAVYCDGVQSCNTPNTNSFCFPAGNHQILYTVNAGHTCSNTAVYNVNVVPTTLVVNTILPAACDNNYCFNVTTTSSCGLSNLITYSWNITSQNNGYFTYSTTTTSPNLCYNLPPGDYVISVYAANDLYAFVNITVPPIDYCPCTACTNILGASGSINSSPLPNQRYCINNNLTINGNVTFANSEFKIGTNITITVSSGAVLTINRSHLYSSTNMWSGIVVQNGGKINIINNSLFEDALIGVSILNHTSQTNILTVDASIFNRNSNAIKIQGYNQNITTYPFVITNSLFTCRKIADCSSIGGWPLTATVKGATYPTSSPLHSPYINNNLYPAVNLKAPQATTKSYRGILLQNVGFSNVTSNSSAYKEIVIGTLSGTNTYNLFDNHWYGIDAQGSNVAVVNSIFQNGHNLAFPALYSIGIRAYSISNVNSQLRVNTPSYTNNNKFYDVNRAIFSHLMHDLNVGFCEMYSTRIYNPAAASLSGAYGVSARSNHYNTVNLNNNRIYNIDNAITFNVTTNGYAVGTAVGNGQFIGSINANDNFIRSQVMAFNINPSLNYGFKAITLTGFIGSSTVTQPNAFVTTTNNFINDYQNGISCSNWSSMGVSSKQNNVTLRNATSNIYQYGIEHVNNSLYNSYAFKQYGIVENTVTTNALSNASNNYGIRSVQNTNYAVVCNTVTNTYNGCAFSGTHINNAFVRFNVMQQNRYGFVLENSGIIGQQGAGYPDGSAEFADNQWLGTWTVPNYKTAILSNSNAQLSKMHVRNGTNFNPNGSGYSFPTNSNYEYSIASGNLLTAALQTTFYSCFLPKPAAQGANIVALQLIASSAVDNSISNASARFVAKNQLYNYLQNNPSAKKPGILTNFYNSNNQKYRETFYDIETNVAQGNINSAKNEVAAFSANNAIESNHKQFFDLVFKYQNHTFTSAEEQSLWQLANKCPYLDGTVVHQARALYNIVTDQNVSFIDSCNYIPSNARVGKLEDENYDTEQPFIDNDVFIYPNPSNGNDVFISVAKTGVEAVDVSINTINGIAIYNESITLANGIGKLNLKVASGVYMVSISIKQTNERVIKKLVIQR